MLTLTILPSSSRAGAHHDQPAHPEPRCTLHPPPFRNIPPPPSPRPNPLLAALADINIHFAIPLLPGLQGRHPALAPPRRPSSVELAVPGMLIHCGGGLRRQRPPHAPSDAKDSASEARSDIPPKVNFNSRGNF